MAATDSYTQTGRPLQLTTPLGKDALLALSITGQEGLSELFGYTITAMALRTKAVAFDQLMGAPIAMALELPGKKWRYFHGMCIRVAQGVTGNEFTDYQLEIVPRTWLLTKKSKSRIFQHITVPDILKKVFAESSLDVEYQIAGTFHKRDYCVQYRETDFNFTCRLMEEEGIFYFFKHEAGKHTMVVANTPQAHPAVPGSATVMYKLTHTGEMNDEDYISEISKVQEQTSGKFVLWDHTFEKPHVHNEAEKQITDTVAVGKVSHKLRVGDNAKLEVYDWPGEYAQRFDGIDQGGSEQAAELSKIPDDAKRTTDLRMQSEAATAVRIQGSGGARQLTSGHKFSLTTLSTDAFANTIKGEGDYALTTVSHAARLPVEAYRSGDGAGFEYSNQFTAIPLALPFRPQRETPKPVVSGSQTAVVVGPSGEEIFTDKYGRIKVQFHWDREGKNDANSSCWIRVAQSSAGKHWGALFIPRIGQEVVVDFLEGDADQPICVGVVYNPEQMPLYKLPDNRTKSYIRTNSSLGGSGYNEVRFEDKAGQEQIYIHAQKNMDTRVRNDDLTRVGNNQHLRVGFFLPNDYKGNLDGEQKKGSQFVEIAVDRHTKVHQHSDEHIVGNTKFLVDGTQDIHIKSPKKELLDATSDLHVKGAVKEKYDATYDQHVVGATKQTIDGTLDHHVKGARADQVGAAMHLTVAQDQNEKIGGGVSVTVGKNHQTKTGMNHAVEAGQEIHLKGGMKVIIEAGMQLTIKGPGGFVDIGPAGVTIQGIMVKINSGGAAGSGSGSSPTAPTAAKDAADAADAADAKPTKPTDADHSETGHKSCK